MTLSKLREDALAFFSDGIESADPYKIVKSKINVSAQHIQLGELSGIWNRIHVLGLGKAACKMLSATLEQLPEYNIVMPVIAVTNDDNSCLINRVTVYASGHPVPDQRGLDANEAVLEKLKDCQQGDLVLLLLSGGGSALLPSPANKLTLSDKILLNQLMLGCGADINAINCVRKHCSRLKGGGLARLAGGADICCLAISDVINNDPSSIASGPTQTDISSFQDAIEVLNKYTLWDNVPDRIRRHLLAGASGLLPETLKSNAELSGLNHFEIIASNTQAVMAVSDSIKSTEYALEHIVTGLNGEARVAAQTLLAKLLSLITPSATDPIAIIAGGETTVTLGSESGKGGRNQELALAFALNAEKIGLQGQWCFLSAGTDGRDGPTDAAGGIVDNSSLIRMRTQGINPEKSLAIHDSYTALAASQDLVITGATGTNVADLQILLWKPIYTSGDQYV